MDSPVLADQLCVATGCCLQNFFGFSHVDTPTLANQLCATTGCRLQDLPGMMDDKRDSRRSVLSVRLDGIMIFSEGVSVRYEDLSAGHCCYW